MVNRPTGYLGGPLQWPSEMKMMAALPMISRSSGTTPVTDGKAQEGHRRCQSDLRRKSP